MKIIFSSILILMMCNLIYPQSVEKMQKLVETEKAFAMAARDTSVWRAFLEFMADDGLIFQPTATNAKEFWQKRPETPALLAWNPVWADISADGKLGYTTGDWSIHPAGKDSNPVAFGQYVTIWKMQPDGNYKAVLDIGISHEKPASVETGWKSSSSDEKSKKRIAPKKSPNLMTENFDKLFADDVRLYRNDKFPFIGRQNALAENKIESANVKTVKILTEKCESSEDFRFCYGEVERTMNETSNEKGNSLQIWKFKNGKWEMVLDLYSPLPDKES